MDKLLRERPGCREGREVLQGRAKRCYGGRSTTMIYSYPFSLASRAVVATMDLSALNLHLLKTDHWLREENNVTQVWLTRSAVAGAGVVMTKGPPTTSLAAWSVEELAAHVSAEDAEGLAAQLRSNSVNGSDFANLRLDDFINDLRFTPFAARKLEALRQKFSQL